MHFCGAEERRSHYATAANDVHYTFNVSLYHFPQDTQTQDTTQIQIHKYKYTVFFLAMSFGYLLLNEKQREQKISSGHCQEKKLYLHAIFSKPKHKPAKKYRAMFFKSFEDHSKKIRQFWAKQKNEPKVIIAWLCCDLFNYSSPWTKSFISKISIHGKWLIQGWVDKISIHGKWLTQGWIHKISIYGKWLTQGWRSKISIYGKWLIQDWISKITQNIPILRKR